MYAPSWTRIGTDVYWLSIPDVKSRHFESIWPTPDGVNYNAYLIGGEDQYLLVDSSKSIINAQELIHLISGIIDPSTIKHVAILHTEPDHSGLIKEIAPIIPNATFHSTSRASSFMRRMFSVDTKVLKDGESLQLGQKTLRAIELPWIHWPDSMFLYLEGDGILFSSDAFGAFGALKKPVFDDEVDFSSYMRQAKEYFATVVVTHRRMILRDLEKIVNLGLDVKMIAPAHGVVLRSRIQEFTQAMKSWCTLEKNRKITVVYGSMYGLTEKLAGFVSEVLKEKAEEVALHNAVEETINRILSDIIDSAGVMFVAPTYEANPFPPIASLLNLLKIKRLGEGKTATVLVTKLWGGSAATQLASGLKEAGFNIFEPLSEYVNYPSEQNLREIRSTALAFCQQAMSGL